MSIGQKMAERLFERVHEQERAAGCGRSDMDLLDYKKVGPHDYRVLVGYSPERGVPRAAALGAWATSMSNGALRVNLATVRDHPGSAVLTMHVRENMIPQPFERSAGMLRTGGGKFMDREQNQWETQVQRDGTKLLVRATDVNVEAILEERKNRQRSGRYASVSLNTFRAAGTADLEVGDTVLYAEPSGGQFQQVGKLTKVGKENVQINGRKGVLDRSYVVDIVDKNPAAKKAQQKYLIDFLTEYEFAGNRQMATKAVK